MVPMRAQQLLAAYYQHEMIGISQIVWINIPARLCKILSKMHSWTIDRTMLFLREAVGNVVFEEVNYLLYESFIYGNKTEDSLTKFKQNNGFMRMNGPTLLYSSHTERVLGTSDRSSQGPKRKVTGVDHGACSKPASEMV